MSSEGQSAVEFPSSREQVRSMASTGRTLQKPIVIPQTSNIFYVRSLSPFACAYAPALAEPPNPILQDEFLAFIEGLNNAFMMHPVFQASFLAGGIATCSQLLPVQPAGGGLQALAVVGSSAVTVVQTKKYLKQANADIFGPRGLTVRICATKTMMQAVGLTEAKLSLPPPSDADGLEFGLLRHTTPSSRSTPAYEQGIPEDPRIRRLRALEGYVSHISFDESQERQPDGALKRYIAAPTRWINSRNERGLVKAREKGLEQQRHKATILDEELVAVNREIEESERLAATQEMVENHHLANQARSIGGSYIGHEKTASQDLAASLERRVQIIEEIKRAGEKKMKKGDKKEERVANRILWIVITRSDDAPLGHEEFVEISDEASQSSR